MKQLLKQITKANNDYSLIEDGDHIAVGFSGGVDSFALALGLHHFKLRSSINFELSFFYLDMQFDNMNMEQASNYLETLGYSLTIITTDIESILKLYPQKNKAYSCSLCSKLKKGYFIDYVKPLGFNKVAFAHHGDDAIETLFLNMMYGGKIASFQPKMFLTNQQITFIRPLVYTFKKQILSYQEHYKWPIVTSTCPNNDHTKRDAIREIVQFIVNDEHFIHHNLLRSLYNDEQVNLWHPLMKTKKTNVKT